MPLLTETDAAHRSLRRIDLMEHAGEGVEIVATTNKNPMRFMLEAWLVVETPVVAAVNLPPRFWHGYRRRTVRLLEYGLSMMPRHH